MKKLLALLMVLAIATGTIACGNNSEPETPDNTQTETNTEAEVVSPEIPEISEETDEEIGDIGYQMVHCFEEVAASADGTTDWMNIFVGTLMDKCEIPLELISISVEPGLLTGFGNTEITGFETGIQFGPMIGSIPFVGYIFNLDAETSADDFKQLLNDNADLNWNVCTSADVITCSSYNDLVFFVMHPASFEEAPVADETVETTGDIIEDTVENVEVPADNGETVTDVETGETTEETEAE